MKIKIDNTQKNKVKVTIKRNKLTGNEKKVKAWKKIRKLCNVAYIEPNSEFSSDF